jgi:histone acetyltransferase (RNA polymerase elongator complex component)
MTPYIIPIFIPHHGCPQQCVFCDQRAITGRLRPPEPDGIAALISERLAGIKQPRPVEVAYYGGSFTALPKVRQLELLAPATAALKRGDIAAIRVSTRPDAIDAATLHQLRSGGVTTVELGAQSLDDRVLLTAKRGHLAADVAAAVKLIKQHGLCCGIQLMPGLPEEDWPSLIGTAARTVALGPDLARIYPAVVLAGTELAERYRQGLFRPLTILEAAARSAYLKLMFNQAGIRVIRVGLQASEELSGGKIVAGPYHPAFGEIVDAWMYYAMINLCVEALPPGPARLTIHHHPREHSKVRGLGNANVKKLQARSDIERVELLPDWPRQRELAIDHQHVRYIVNETMLFVI